MNRCISRNLISVIVPVYNGQEYLCDCINSLINQTYINLEIILIDDGSSDDSGRICDKYADLDKRVKAYHQQNLGLVSARRTGIELAKGEYITFVDSDDYIDLNTYEIIINKINESRPDLVLFGLVEEYADHRQRKKNYITEGWYNKEKITSDILPIMLSAGNYFDFGVLPNIVCKLINKELITKAKLDVDVDITIGEDAAHTFQLISFASDILVLDLYPYHYCKRNDSMMWKKTAWKNIIKLESNLRENFIRAGIFNVMEKQLNEYISFVALLKKPDKILNTFSLFSSTDSRIALYGAGGMGQAVHEIYKNKISVWVDKNYKNYVKLNLMVEDICALKTKNNYDSIFIAILNVNTCRDISRSLRENGIGNVIYYYDGKIGQLISV